MRRDLLRVEACLAGLVVAAVLVLTSAPIPSAVVVAWLGIVGAGFLLTYWVAVLEEERAHHNPVTPPRIG